LKSSDGQDTPMNSAYASLDLSEAKEHELEIVVMWREVAETEMRGECMIEEEVLCTERMLR